MVRNFERLCTGTGEMEIVRGKQKFGSMTDGRKWSFENNTVWNCVNDTFDLVLSGNGPIFKIRRLLNTVYNTEKFDKGNN